MQRLLGIVIGCFTASVAFGAAGELDRHFDTFGQTFGDSGFVATGADGGASGVLVEPDGRIVVSGSVPARGDQFSIRGLALPLVRYHRNGAIDLSFGTGGVASAGTDCVFCGASNVIRQPDGRYLVAGSAPDFEDAVARYLPDGSPDPSWGGDGVVSLPGPLNASATDIALQPDGRVVVAGSSGSLVAYAARLLPDGGIDPDFGTGGIAILPTKDAAAVAVQPDGKIVVAGQIGDPRRDVALVRLEANGSFDMGFGTGGVVQSDLQDDDRATAVLVQPDGRIALLAFSGVGPGFAPPFVAVLGYEADGSPDPSFGIAGRAIVGFTSLTGPARALVRQPDGKLLIGGSASVAGGPFRGGALARLMPDGTADPTFGAAGFILPTGLDVGAPRPLAFESLALGPDGQIVAAGGPGFRVVRHLGDPICGDGARDVSEVCDDGNTLGGDCCSATCDVAAADGTACDDSALCTTGGTCGGGVCTGGSTEPARRMTARLLPPARAFSSCSRTLRADASSTHAASSGVRRMIYDAPSGGTHDI